MRELERRVQRDFDRIADQAPVSSESWEQLRQRLTAEPDRIEEEVIMLAPAEPTSTRPRWTPAVAVALAAVAALAVVGIIVLRADGDTVTTEDATVTPADADATAVTPVDWQYGGSLPGELEDVAAWSEGLAAILDEDGDETPTSGKVWYSTDGLDWSTGPSNLRGDAFMLAGQNGDLFALTGDPDNPGATQTLWHRRTGEPWTEVVTSDALDHMAVGPERLIAYGEAAFSVVGVFDTATLAPIEFVDQLKINLEPAATDPTTGEPVEPVVLEGHAIALDEGFLAHMWVTTVDDNGEADRERTLMYSADGTAWIEHPDHPDGGVFLPYPTPVYDGLNLLSLPNQLDTEPWITDDGRSFLAAADPGFNGPTGTDDGFFTVDESHRVHHSLDGVTWTQLQAPPTWPYDAAPAAAEDGEVQHGSIYTLGDRLLAIGLRGDFEGWVGYINPTTEIWVTDR